MSLESELDRAAQELAQQSTVRQDARMTAGAAMSLDVDAAQELKVGSLAEALGEPVDFVRDNYRSLERDARNRGVFDRLPEDSITKKVLSDPTQLDLQEDIPGIAKVEGTLDKILKDMDKSVEFGDLTAVAGPHSFRTMWEEPDKYREGMAEYDALMQSLEGRESDLGWVAQTPGDVAEFVGQYSQMMTSNSVLLPVALAATLETAWSARLGMPSTYKGTRTVMALSMGKEMFEMETGLAYREFIDLTSPDGTPIHPNTARGGALLVGAINGGFEFLGGWAVGKSAGLIGLEGLTKNQIKNLMRHPRVRERLYEIGAGFTLGAAGEGLTEALQEISQIAFATYVEGEIPEGSWDRIGHAFSQGFRTGGGLAAPNVVVQTAGVVKQKTEAQRRSELFEALGMDASETEVLKSAPNKFKELVKQIRDKHGKTGKIYVDSEAARTFFQDVDEQVMQENMPDTWASLQEAEANPAAYVEIPIEEFSAYVAPSMDFGTLIDDMTFDVTVPTPRDLEASQAEMQEFLDWYEESQGIIDTESDPLYGRVLSELIMAGRSVEVATSEAEIATRMLTFQAGKVGMEPYDYYRSKNIRITKEMDIAPERMDVPSYFGGLLNLIREGRGPTQRDVFGPSLVEFLIAQGGINETAELGARDLDKAMPEYGKRRLSRPEGMDMTGAFEAARDAGYLELGGAASEEAALLAAIDTELAGERQYVPGLESAEDLEMMAALDQLEGQIRAAGIDIDTMSNDEIMAELGLSAFGQEASGRRLAQELTKWEMVGDLNNLKQYEPEAYEAVQSFLSRQSQEESERIEGKLSEFAGTAWSASAVKGMIIREAMYRAWDGQSPESLLNLGMWGKRALSAGGMGKALMKGRAGIELFASGYKFIGGNRKAEQDFSGSYANCNPSRDCATQCYAARGTSYNTSLMMVEFTEFIAETNPQLLADSIATQYEQSDPGKGGLALRINEKGELSPAQLDVIQRLNDKGIRIQIFSKRPELLAQADENNLRMLSVDGSNLAIAEGNDFGLAVVINEGITQEWIQANNDRVSVYLPVKLGNKETTQAELKARFPEVYSAMQEAMCPVDGGKLSLPEKNTSYVNIGGKKGIKGVWTCTSCDHYGTHGCFHGDRQSSANRLDVNRNTKPAADEVMTQFLDALERLKAAGEIDDARYSSILETISTGVSVNEGNPIGQTTDGKREEPSTRSTAYGKDKQAIADVAGLELIPVRTLYQRAWHGAYGDDEYQSFQLKYIGTGEGAQVYGWGMYFAQRFSTAKWYRENMRKKWESRYDETGIFDSEDVSAYLSDVGAIWDLVGMKTDGEIEAMSKDPDLAQATLEWHVIATLDDVYSRHAAVDTDLWEPDIQRLMSGKRAKALASKMSEILGRELALGDQAFSDDDLSDDRQTWNIDIGNFMDDVIVPLVAEKLDALPVETRKKKKARGYIYETNVPEDSELIYFDQAMHAQPRDVYTKLSNAGVLRTGPIEQVNQQLHSLSMTLAGIDTAYYGEPFWDMARPFFEEFSPELLSALDRVNLPEGDNTFYDDLMSHLDLDEHTDEYGYMLTANPDDSTWKNDEAREVLEKAMDGISQMIAALNMQLKSGSDWVPSDRLQEMADSGVVDIADLFVVADALGEMHDIMDKLYLAIPPSPRTALGGAPTPMSFAEAADAFDYDIAPEDTVEGGGPYQSVLYYPSGIWVEVTSPESGEPAYYAQAYNFEMSTNDLAEMEKWLAINYASELEDTDFPVYPVAATTDTRSGREFYGRLPEHPKVQEWVSNEGLANERGDKQASLYLNSLGIPGLRYRDGNTRHANRDEYTYNYVIWNEEQIKIEAVNKRKRMLEQPGRGKKPRGYTDVAEDNTSYRITLTDQANLSTFIHEMGHLMLELMQQDVLDGVASPEAVAEFALIEQYLEVRKPGVRVDGKFTTEQHELFARSIEAYFYEGRAPSQELAMLMKRTKEYMKSVYSSLHKLDAPLSDELRRVFDKMIAGDKAVEGVVEEVSPDMDYAALGLDELAIARLNRLHAAAVQEGLDDIQEQIRRELARTRDKQYRADKKLFLVDVADEVDAEEVYGVQNLMRKGVDKFRITPPEWEGKKLDSQSVVRIFGGDSSVLKRIAFMYQKDGLNPEAVADVYGFESAERMVQEIAAAPKRQDVINQRVQTRLDEKYGDIKTDTELINRAAIAVHNDDRSHLLVAEANAASRRIGGKATQSLGATVRTAAQRMISEMPLRRINPHKYYQAEQRAAKNAQIAAGEGKMEDFLMHTRMRLMNHHLYREGQKAITRAERLRKNLSEAGKPKRLKWRKTAPELARAIETLLASYEFKKLPLKTLDARALVRQQINLMNAEGEPVLIDPEMLADTKRTNYKELTLAELSDINDQVKLWSKQGREANQARVDGQDMDAAELVETMDATAQLHKNEAKQDTWLVEPNSPGYKVGRWLRDYIASLGKMEFRAREADGGLVGIWYRTLFHPFVVAQNNRDNKLIETNNQLKEIMGTLDKEDAKRLADTTTFMGENVLVGDLYLVVLNLGNDGNKARLLNGYGWNEQGVLDALQDSLTVEDFQRIQAIGEVVDSFYDEMAQVSERVDGIIPPKVERAPIRLERLGITLDGFYFPVKYKDDVGTPVRQTQDDQGITMGASPMTGQVSKSMTKSRAEGVPAGKINLSYNTLGTHINQVIHYMTHYEAVRNIEKLSQRDDFRSMYQKYWGRAGYKQLRDWVQNIATDGRLSQSPLSSDETFNRGMRHVRTGTSMVALGWDIVGAMKQTLGLASTAAEVGPVLVARNVLKYLYDAGRGQRSNDDSLYMTAYNNSPEIRNMTLQMDRDVRELTQGNLAQAGGMPPAGVYGSAVHSWRWARSNSFLFIAFVQQQVNAITWHAGYEKAQQQGMTHDESVDYANAVVRQSQSGGGLKDLSGIQASNNELVKGATMFITWGIVVYNHLEMTGRQDLLRGFIQGKGPHSRTKSMLRFANTIGWYVVASTMLDQMFFQDEPDDDETTAGNFVWGLAGTATFGIPVVRDVVSMMDGFAPTTPLAKMMKDLSRIDTDADSGDVYAIASGLTAATHLPARSVVEVFDALTQKEWDDKVKALLTGVPYHQRLEAFE